MKSNKVGPLRPEYQKNWPRGPEGSSSVESRHVKAALGRVTAQESALAFSSGTPPEAGGGQRESKLRAWSSAAGSLTRLARCWHFIPNTVGSLGGLCRVERCCSRSFLIPGRESGSSVNSEWQVECVRTVDSHRWSRKGLLARGPCGQGSEEEAQLQGQRPQAVL